MCVCVWRAQNTILGKRVTVSFKLFQCVSHSWSQQNIDDIFAWKINCNRSADLLQPAFHVKTKENKNKNKKHIGLDRIALSNGLKIDSPYEISKKKRMKCTSNFVKLQLSLTSLQTHYSYTVCTLSMIYIAVTTFAKHFKYVQVTKLKLLIGICNWFWFAFLLRLKLNYQQKWQWALSHRFFIQSDFCRCLWKKKLSQLSQ